jgi:hypothetical protein
MHLQFSGTGRFLTILEHMILVTYATKYKSGIDRPPKELSVSKISLAIDNVVNIPYQRIRVKASVDRRFFLMS